MNLVEQVNKDFLVAYKAKDEAKSSVLRMLKSSLQLAEKEKGEPLDDALVSKIVQKEVKQRRESVKEYRKGGRDDLAKKEEAEISILESYLPDQLGKDELENIIKETIRQVGAKSQADMGKIMGAVMPKVAGKADGGEVSKIVNQLLG